MLWTFDIEGFMSYMVAEFPEPMSNHFTYDLVQNVVEDAQMRYLEKNHFASMLVSLIPEVAKEEVLMFCIKERMDERENIPKTSPLLKSALFGEITPGTVVHCKTEKEARELLSFAEELGYLWLDHEQPLQRIKFAFHKDQTCYKFGDELDVYGREGKFISFGPLAAFKSKETPVLSYNEFFASLQKQIFESLDEEREV